MKLKTVLTRAAVAVAVAATGVVVAAEPAAAACDSGGSAWIEDTAHVGATPIYYWTGWYRNCSGGTVKRKAVLSGAAKDSKCISVAAGTVRDTSWVSSPFAGTFQGWKSC